MRIKSSHWEKCLFCKHQKCSVCQINLSNAGVNSVSGNVCHLQLAGERCRKSFAEAEGNKEKELKLMLDWAFEGFLPTGPDGFAPPGR